MTAVKIGEDAIETPRLRLTYAHSRDFHDWATLRRDSREHLEPWEPAWPQDALSREDWSRRVKAWRAGRKAGTSHVFLARMLKTNGLVGGAGLTNIRFGSAQSASLGYWLGEPHQGQGYMTEAVRGVCIWAFHWLGLERVEAGTLPENTASQSVLERVGFKEEGFARAYLEIGGRRRDHVLFGLVTGDLPR